MLIPSPPPEELFRQTCSSCNLKECSSITGRFNDVDCKEWIGCGSPLLAINSEVWTKMCHQGIRPNNFRAIQKENKRILQRDNKIPGFWQEWTLGCPIIGQNKYAVITAAHPVKNVAQETSLIYLSQIREGPEVRIVELGTETRQVHDMGKGLDILILKLHDNFDETMLAKKIHSSCDDRYIDFEPLFDHEPEIRAEVTKRGSASGNTFGVVITNNTILIPNVSNEPVDAFGVTSIETNSETYGFAKNGDSGSIVLQNHRADPKRRAFGIISCKQKLFSEIQQRFVPNAIVCVKITNCLRYIKEHFSIEPAPRPSMELQDCVI